MRGRVWALAAAMLAAPCQAAPVSLRVGDIQSEKSCTTYTLTSGRHREAGVIDAYGAAYASETSWRTYLVRDCVDHFASLRTSIQAALASTGKFAVASGPNGGGYVISGRISDVSGGGPADPAQRAPRGDFAVASSRMTVNMDVTVRDGSGRTIFGGLLTKQFETGFSMETKRLATSDTRSGEAVYTQLQHEVALAVARMVAFKLEPLRVIGLHGNQIELNYGAPLLQLGTMVQITAPGGAQVRYNLVGAGQGVAQAEYQGGSDPAAVIPGSIGMVIEADDPAANARRFERVDLP